MSITNKFPDIEPQQAASNWRVMSTDGAPISVLPIAVGQKVVCSDRHPGWITHLLPNKDGWTRAFVIQTRGWWRRTVVIPIDYIDHIEGETVYLSLTKPDLKKLPTYRPDHVLVGAVLQSLWEDTIFRRTEYRQVHVEVENGIAYLSGYVSSPAMSAGAEKAALKADGIWKVVNLLAIDSEIHLAVFQAIGEAPDLAGRSAAQEQAVPIIAEGRLVGWVGSSIDIQNRNEAERVLRKSEIQTATQRLLLEAREDERTIIAREIHDGPLQTLMGMVFDLQNLKEEDTDQAVKAGLLRLESSLKNTIQELRQFVNELRPPALIDVGLVEAIQKHITDIHEKFPELELGIDLDERINVLSERLSLTLYRICQEALQNVIRHAKATKVVIHGSSDDDQVILIIQDNGIGFSATNHFAELAANQHYGLTGMKERAEAVGGTLQVSSRPGSGTRIEACIPLHQTIIQTIAGQPNCARDLLTYGGKS